MSRLLLESGPPDALALEDGSGVVLLEDDDAALERRDPLYVRIDRPDWRIGWTAGFNVNLHGVVVAPPEAPAGTQLTERPLLAAPVQLNQRTWLWNYNPNLIAQDRMTVGAKLTERPPVPPYYREWSQSLLQWTLAPLPPGIKLSERPPVPPWYRTWSVTLQQTTLAPAEVRRISAVITELPPRDHQRPIALRTWIHVGVPQELFPSFVTGWDIGQGVDWRRSWVQNLLQSTLSTPPVALPAGRGISDRPPVPPWFRSWLVNLQQSTLAPAPAAKPVGSIVADRPLGLRWFHSWLVGPLRVAVAPSVQTDWPLPRAYPFGPDLRTWTAFYNRNLIGRDRRVAGQALTDRPPVTFWYCSLTLTLQQSTLAPPPGAVRPAMITVLPPRGHRHPTALRTWTAQYNANLIGKDLLPFAQFVWPPGPAPVFMPDLRTLTERHNFDLVDVFPEPPPTGGLAWDTTDPWFYDWWRKKALEELAKFQAREEPTGTEEIEATSPVPPPRRSKSRLKPETLTGLQDARTLTELRMRIAELDRAQARIMRAIVRAYEQERERDEEEAEFLLLH